MASYVSHLYPSSDYTPVISRTNHHREPKSWCHIQASLEHLFHQSFWANEPWSIHWNKSASTRAVAMRNWNFHRSQTMITLCTEKLQVWQRRYSRHHNLSHPIHKTHQCSLPKSFFSFVVSGTLSCCDYCHVWGSHKPLDSLMDSPPETETS